MSPISSFQIGDRVVYPNHGVGTIENISMRTFGPKTERFYLLKLATNSLTVMIPFSHVSDVGLRRVTRNSELQRVLEFLAAGSCRISGDWKNRFKENSEKMRMGSLLSIAEVFKSLLVQQRDKALSFREKKMLDRSRHMLLMELSSSRCLSLGEASEVLRRALGKAQLPMPEPL